MTTQLTEAEAAETRARVAAMIKAMRRTDRYVRVVCSFRDKTDTYSVDVKAAVTSIDDITSSTCLNACVLGYAARRFKDDHGIHRCTKVKAVLDGLHFYED